MSNTLGYNQEANGQLIYDLPVNMVFPNPFQPRRYFEPMALVDLATSIKQHGLMQPITVRLVDRGYELISGERRLRASKLAELATIPAIIVDITDAESAVLAMVENLQRQNLNYIEEAEGLSMLIEEHGLTQEELAKKIGKNQSTIANKLRLLKLPDAVKKILVENNLTERHARALLKILKTNEGEIAEGLLMQALKAIIQKGLTVQKTEEYVDKLLSSPQVKKPENTVKMYIKDLRIFTNTVKQAVGIMQDSGVNATYDVEESKDGCVITVLVSY